ncbi:MAG: hypothetical protein EBR82_17190 [Caulobacteraceae bacterium]|nr:hypothetical protein [Caulobacteraceae bacterium]
MVDIILDGTTRALKLGDNTQLSAVYAAAAAASATAAANSASTFGYFDTLGAEARVSFEDAAGNSLMEVTGSTVTHPQIIGLAANDVLNTPARETVYYDLLGAPRLPIEDSAGNLLGEVLPDRIDHPQIITMAAAIAALQGKTAMNWYGDSLSAGFPSYPTPGSVMATALGRTVNVQAIPGQAAGQISTRAGARARTVRFSGGAIAAGANTITYIDGQTIAYWQGLSTATKSAALFLSTPSNTSTNTCRARINGLKGTVTRTSSAGVEAYSFTPDSLPSGVTSVAVADDTPLRIDVDGQDLQPCVIWVGRNDLPATGAGTTAFNNAIAAILAEVAAMVQRFDLRRCLILGVINALDENAGSKSDVFNAIISLNNQLATLYPGAFVDIRKDLIVNGLALASISPTATDTTNIGTDNIPSSLLDNPASDKLHLGAAGYAAVGTIVGARTTAKGF